MDFCRHISITAGNVMQHFVIVALNFPVKSCDRLAPATPTFRKKNLYLLVSTKEFCKPLWARSPLKKSKHPGLHESHLVSVSGWIQSFRLNWLQLPRCYWLRCWCSLTRCQRTDRLAVFTQLVSNLPHKLAPNRQI